MKEDENREERTEIYFKSDEKRERKQGKRKKFDVAFRLLTLLVQMNLLFNNIFLSLPYQELKMTIGKGSRRLHLVDVIYIFVYILNKLRGSDSALITV